MTDIFDTEPTFINPEGTKWWVDKDITRYCQKEDKHGTVLDAVCFYVEMKDGSRTRVLISKNQEIIEEDTTIDGMGLKIDVRKMLKRDIEKEQND